MTQHRPSPIANGVEPYAVDLIERRRGGRLVIYAGAGVSRSEPAGIPPGADVAALVVAKLRPAFPILDGVPPADLPAVADAIAGLDGGEKALLGAIVSVAEFNSATPNYAHKILSALLLEGVLDILTTNWDTCIERGNRGEPLSAVVTSHDLASVTPPSVLKIHGCATQPGSLLVTSEHLAAPPSWVVDQTRSRLGTATVAFVGIGDIAGYVRLRIQEAIAEVGRIENIRVVSPGIDTKWDSSQWSQLAPDLDSDQRIAATADVFMEQLGRAYVLGVFGDIALEFASDPQVLNLAENARRAVNAHDSLKVLAWARMAAVVPRAGYPILDSESMTTAFCALGKLLPDGFSLEAQGTVRAENHYVQVLVSPGRTAASRMQREARIRATTARTEGREVPCFLVAGGIGWGHCAGLPADILDHGSEHDILDGPLSQPLKLIRAEDVLA